MCSFLYDKNFVTSDRSGFASSDLVGIYEGSGQPATNEETMFFGCR